MTPPLKLYNHVNRIFHFTDGRSYCGPVRVGVWLQNEESLCLCHPAQPPLHWVLFPLQCEVERRFAIWGLELCTFDWTVPDFHGNRKLDTMRG